MVGERITRRSIGFSFHLRTRRGAAPSSPSLCRPSECRGCGRSNCWIREFAPAGQGDRIDAIKGSRRGPPRLLSNVPCPWGMRSPCVPPEVRLLSQRGAGGKAPHAIAQRVGLSGRFGLEIGVDAGAAFLIVTLGKRSPMPYVCSRDAWPASPPRADTGVRTTAWSARMVEVPNPANFVG